MTIYSVIGVGEHHKFFDANSYHDAIRYISQNGTAPYVGGANITSMETAATEMKATATAFGKDSGKRLRHSVVSFDQSEGITPEQAHAYGQQIIQYYAPEYQIAYAVHTNTENPHIHLVMNQVSYVDGHRYRGDKADYYSFKRHIQSVTHRPVMLMNNKHPEK